MVVACVSHSHLKTEHREFLKCLALFAEPDGSKVHPGFEKLAAMMQKSEETVRRYARHCETLALIEVTQPPYGKKISTEWRICTEHDAFPGEYPGFRSTASRGPKADLGPQKLPYKADLGPQKQQENSFRSTPTCGPTTNQHQLQHHHQQDETAIDDAKACVVELLKKFVEQEGQAPKNIANKHKAAMAELALEHGREIFLRAGRVWLRASPWNSKTEWPFASFISGFDGYAAEVDYDKKVESQRLTPEIIAESNRIANALHEAVWAVPEKEEPSAEAFLDEAVTDNGSDGEVQ